MLLSFVFVATINALFALSFPASGSDNALQIKSPKAALLPIIDQRVPKQAPSPVSAVGPRKQPEVPKHVKSEPKSLKSPSTSSSPKQKDPSYPRKGAKGQGPSRKNISEPPILPDTTFTTNEGNITVKSRLINFTGCSAAQTKSINLAFADALRLANSVGNPDLMWKGNVEPLAIYDYYGRKNDRAEVQNRIRGRLTTPCLDRPLICGIDNWKRAQLPGTQWRFGDWWFKRYIEIHCDDPWGKADPKKGCISGSRAYETEPKTPAEGNPGEHPSISLCPKFFDDETLDTRIQDITDGVWNDNDVRNLVCQASHFLHEMFHMALRYPKSINPNIDPGISNPRCTSKVYLRRLKAVTLGS